MATTLSTQINASVQYDLKETDALGKSINRDFASAGRAIELADGTAAAQANARWRSIRTLAPTTPETLDLMALPDSVFGGSYNMVLTAVRALLVRVITTDAAAYLLIGGAAAPIWEPFVSATGDKIKVPADGEVLLVNKAATPVWTVSVGAGHKLKIDNPTAVSVQYEICIIGTK